MTEYEKPCPEEIEDEIDNLAFAMKSTGLTAIEIFEDGRITISYLIMLVGQFFIEVDNDMNIGNIDTMPG